MSVDWTQPTFLCGDAFQTLAAPYLPAEIATIMLGTNDAIGTFMRRATLVATYASRIRELITKLQEHGVRTVVLMTPPPMCREARVGAARIRLVGYREKILEICESLDGVVCGPDTYALLDPHADFDACDAHPNASGHAVIARALSETVRSIIAAKPGQPG
jgi:lysophospholipase L1-like esterase